MRLALDSNRYRDLCDDHRETLAMVREAEIVYLPFIVIAELRAGFSLGTRGRENERILQRFLMKPGVEILYPDDATTHSYAALYGQLRRQGTPIPTNDIWIAALVVEHDLALCTRDAHFKYLPQLNTV